MPAPLITAATALVSRRCAVHGCERLAKLVVRTLASWRLVDAVPALDRPWLAMHTSSTSIVSSGCGIASMAFRYAGTLAGLALVLTLRCGRAAL